MRPGWNTGTGHITKYQPNPFLKHLDVKLECSVRLEVMVAVLYFIEMPEFFVFTSDFQLVTVV